MPPVKRYLTRLVAKKAKDYLPKSNLTLSKGCEIALNQCMIENCLCRDQDYTESNDLIIDSLIHKCPLRHHSNCPQLQQYKALFSQVFTKLSAVKQCVILGETFRSGNKDVLTSLMRNGCVSNRRSIYLSYML